MKETREKREKEHADRLKAQKEESERLRIAKEVQQREARQRQVGIINVVLSYTLTGTFYGDRQSSYWKRSGRPWSRHA